MNWIYSLDSELWWRDFFMNNGIFTLIYRVNRPSKHCALIDTQNPSAYHSGLFKQRNSRGDYAVFVLLPRNRC
jgi:hypothetical protein